MKSNLLDYIVHEDQDFLVLNKWAGISTLSDRNMEVCLLDKAKKYYSDLQVCHRLDKYTSGILVFAKHQKAYRHLALQFQNRTVQKKYHAIVEGRHLFKDKIIDLPLHQGRRGHVRVSHMSGKASQTVVTTIKPFNTHTLLCCEPTTGRTHQIRVHLSAIEAPLAGDVAYGGKELLLSDIKRHYNLRKNSYERPLMSRPALHAKSLNFEDLAGKRVDFEADYPKDFRATLNQLDKISSISQF